MRHCWTHITYSAWAKENPIHDGDDHDGAHDEGGLFDDAVDDDDGDDDVDDDGARASSAAAPTNPEPVSPMGSRGPLNQHQRAHATTDASAADSAGAAVAVTPDACEVCGIDREEDLAICVNMINVDLQAWLPCQGRMHG